MSGRVVKVRTLAEINEPSRAAWVDGGHRGAVLDAVRMCRQYTAPLPEWLADAVDEAVTWWLRQAPTTGKTGRHARFPIARRAIVQDWERADMYRQLRQQGLSVDDARAMTAEWFRVGENTIRDSVARARRLGPTDRYWGPDDRRQLGDSLRRLTAAEQRRWMDLSERYRGRARPGPKKKA